MDTTSIISTFGVLLFTITLIWGISWLILKLQLVPGLKRKSLKNPNPDKLLIIENLTLDTKRRLVKVEDGDYEHLILLGGTNETHIHTRKTNENNSSEEQGENEITAGKPELTLHK